jgi:hypothetical protein
VAFAEWRLPSVTLGKEFAKCKLTIAECNRHLAKPVNPVVTVESMFFAVSACFINQRQITMHGAISVKEQCIR